MYKASKNVSQQRNGSLREVPPTKTRERGEHSTWLVTTAPRERGKIILVEVVPPAAVVRYHDQIFGSNGLQGMLSTPPKPFDHVLHTCGKIGF